VGFVADKVALPVSTQALWFPFTLLYHKYSKDSWSQAAIRGLFQAGQPTDSVLRHSQTYFIFCLKKWWECKLNIFSY